MRRVYDVFEKFSDGSTLWRASVNGKFEASRKIQELSEHSGNEFFFLDITAEDFLPAIPVRQTSRHWEKRAMAG